MDTITVADLQAAVAGFVDERDWQVYHTPKSLSMSIAIEAAELMEHFQWHGNGDSRRVALEPEVSDAVAGELADVTEERAARLAPGGPYPVDLGLAGHAVDLLRSLPAGPPTASL